MPLISARLSAALRSGLALTVAAATALAGVVLVVPATVAQAAGVLDQTSWDTPDRSSYTTATSSSARYQTFTAGRTGVIDGISLHVRPGAQGASSPAISVEVVELANGSPWGGAVIGRGVVPGSASGWTAVGELELDAPVVAGSQYGLRLRSSSDTQNVTFDLYGGYQGGSWWNAYQEPDRDRVSVGFRTYVDTSRSQPTMANAPSSNAIVRGDWYSHQFAVTGSPRPTVTVTAGSLPPGVVLSSWGTVSGAPTTTGSYTFTTSASNGIGSAATVESTIVVRDPALATAPRDLTITTAPSNGSISAAWTAPASFGDGSLRYYVVSLGGESFTFMGTSITLTGARQAGATYTFSVHAVTDRGAGAAATGSVVWRTTASAPTVTSATPGAGAVDLVWSAPASDGANAIQGYWVEYRASGVSTWTARPGGIVAGTSTTVSGLSNGTFYQFRVAAANAAGTGAWSNVTSAIPRTVPAGTSGIAVSPLSGAVGLRWPMPTETGGSGITGFLLEGREAGGLWAPIWSTPQFLTQTTIRSLTNGTAYQYRVAAVNVAGQGPWVESPIVTPRTVPNAPTSIVAVPGDSSVELAWTAPEQDGGDAVTSYVVEHWTAAGGWVRMPGTVAGTSTTVAGLSNGTFHTFRVAAVNAAGAGAWGLYVSSTPRTVPAAPSGIAVEPRNGSARLAWPAVTETGGASIQGYLLEMREVGGAWTPLWSTPQSRTEATVLGLTNGRAYQYRVAAVNAAGQSPWVESPTVTPRTVPGAPTGIVAVPGDSAVGLSWTAPESDGGDAVASYVVEQRTGDGAWVAVPADAISGTTASIVGLANGTAYEFRVAAANAAGRGAWSIPAPSAPRTVPGAPTGLAAVPGDSTVDLSWIAPEADGGDAVASYVVERRVAEGEWIAVAADAIEGTTASVAELENGTAYEFRVAAVNAAGVGAWSDSASSTPRTVADAPTALSAAPGDSVVDLSWSAPEWNGGEAVASYVVEHRVADGEWIAVAADAIEGTTMSVAELENGTSYEFRVAAVNAAGAGAWSDSASSTPRTVADVPTALSATPGDSVVDLSWTEPEWDGGDAVASYVVEHRVADGDWIAVAAEAIEGTTMSVAELDNGTSYEFRVAAVNAAGAGAWSASASSTPRTVADAPTGLTAVPADSVVDLSWTAPEWDGGDAVASYVVEHRVADGEWIAVPAAAIEGTTASVAELENGTAYEFRVAAVNAAGAGAWSESASSTPRTLADAPTGLTAVPGDSVVDLSWTAPEWDGGDDVASYVVEHRVAAGEWIAVAADAIVGTRASVVELENGTAYEFRVAAVNAAGAGAWSDSASSTPRTLAGAPSGLAAVPGDSVADLAWTAPEWDGGAPITSYVVEQRSADGDWMPADAIVDGTTARVENLANGAAVELRVAAVTAAGTGAWSETVATTPFLLAISIAGPDGDALDGATLRPGDEVTVRGTDLPVGASLRIEMHSTVVVLGEAAVDATGAVTATVAIPVDAELGAHELQVHLLDAGAEVAPVVIDFVVEAAPVAPAPAPAATDDALPSTGSAVDELALMLAAAALLLGLALVVTRRVRRTDA